MSFPKKEALFLLKEGNICFPICFFHRVFSFILLFFVAPRLRLKRRRLTLWIASDSVFNYRHVSFPHLIHSLVSLKKFFHLSRARFLPFFARRYSSSIFGKKWLTHVLREVILPTRFPQLFEGKRTPWKGILLPPQPSRAHL